MRLRTFTNGRNHFRAENGSSQGQNLALTGVFVPSWLDSGLQVEGLFALSRGRPVGKRVRLRARKEPPQVN